MTEFLDSLDLAVDRMLARIPGPLAVGAPLGIGKPHRLLNVLYGRVERDASRTMALYTALSLDPPSPGKGLEGRFLGPFVARHFGDDFPRLDYVAAQKRDALPDSVTVEEFYVQSGALLGSSQAQRHYASLNYTHVARALVDRGVNCIVQKVAANAEGTQLSLSSNTDLTFDAVDAIVAAGLPRPLLVAEIDPLLPWLGGTAAVPLDFFDIVVAPPAPYPKLFALPRQPVGASEPPNGLTARPPVHAGGPPPEGTQLSLSSNTDLTFDAVDAIVAAGLPRPLLVAEIDPLLPWLGGTAAVPLDFFDIVVAPPAPYPKLFALPRQPVGDAEHAIGLYASALVRDGGTLQVGIGALSDALCHALALRHVDNAAYRRVLAALDPDLEHHPAVIASGGLGPFEQGLYGCSEMINEGFKLLVERGVMRRRVVDKLPLMQRMDDGTASERDRELVERDGQFLHGAFYLGSQDFYDWLRDLDDDTRHGIGMCRVGEVNQLYGGNEVLERAQRRESRFFNTCMMATALGAAVSAGLDAGRVGSGAGGQYHFVAVGSEGRGVGKGGV